MSCVGLQSVIVVFLGHTKCLGLLWVGLNDITNIKVILTESDL